MYSVIFIVISSDIHSAPPFPSPPLSNISDGHKITDTDPDVFEQLLRWIYVDEIDEGAIEAFGEQILMGANR